MTTPEFNDIPEFEAALQSNAYLIGGLEPSSESLGIVGQVLDAAAVHYQSADILYNGDIHPTSAIELVNLFDLSDGNFRAYEDAFGILVNQVHQGALAKRTRVAHIASAAPRPFATPTSEADYWNIHFESQLQQPISVVQLFMKTMDRHKGAQRTSAGRSTINRWTILGENLINRIEKGETDFIGLDPVAE